ncbi:DNA primase [Patescibacteria group bacterium]|nr:DNA primase [Patescibacteria group bacterium]
MDVVDEIKSKLDIVDVISDYVHLKQSGTSFKAPCPFHKEENPSFHVSQEKQIWHCFGCSKGSDMFGFVQEIEGIDFPEALRILAKKAGVNISEKKDKSFDSAKTKLLDICNISAKFYHKVLMDSKSANSARKYLKQRNLKKKTIEEFELGFAPDKWDTLLNFLIKRGFSFKHIEMAGLIVKSRKSSNKYYDRFRNRIMFPIRDMFGQTIGFTSRIMPEAEDDQIGKYINTPETQIYNKSRVLYGLDMAKQKIRHYDKVILVEGNVDVISAHQADTKNVVCTSGTALTDQQANILKRYTENIILGFDVDLAGQTATSRSIDLLLKQGLDVKILELTKGKDPDECIREDIKSWKQAVKNPIPIMEYYFSLVLKDKDLANLSDRKEVTKTLLPIIAKLGDSVEQGLWLKNLSNKINVSEVFLIDALKKINASKRPTYSSQPAQLAELKTGIQQIQEKFLAMILTFPEQGKKVLDKLLLDMFETENLKQILTKTKEYFDNSEKIEAEKIKKTIKDKDLLNYFTFLTFLADKEFKGFKKEKVDRELTKSFNLFKKRYLNTKIERLIDELRHAEEEGNKQDIKEISQKINGLSKQISK